MPSSTSELWFPCDSSSLSSTEVSVSMTSESGFPMLWITARWKKNEFPLSSVSAIVVLLIWTTDPSSRTYNMKIQLIGVFSFNLTEHTCVVWVELFTSGSSSSIKSGTSSPTSFSLSLTPSMWSCTLLKLSSNTSQSRQGSESASAFPSGSGLPQRRGESRQGDLSRNYALSTSNQKMIEERRKDCQLAGPWILSQGSHHSRHFGRILGTPGSERLELWGKGSRSQYRNLRLQNQKAHWTLRRHH